MLGLTGDLRPAADGTPGLDNPLVRMQDLTCGAAPTSPRYRREPMIRIYVLPLGTARINFEIIKPSTWTYISLKTVTLTGSSYQAVTTDSWDALDANVFVRVSLIYNGSFSAVRIGRSHRPMRLLLSCVY
jgi:hypothetical protein